MQEAAESASGKNGGPKGPKGTRGIVMLPNDVSWTSPDDKRKKKKWDEDDGEDEGSNFASNGANTSASASLTRLEQRLSTDPAWLMLSTTDAAPAAKINKWVIKTAHKLAEILEVDIAQRLGEQISPPAATSAASTRTVTIRSGENASAMSPFPVNNKPEKPGL